MPYLENSIFATIAVFLIAACSQPPDRIAPAKNTSFYSSNEVATLTAPTTDNPPISIASFNIQFLGNSTRRDNLALANVVSPYDVVVVQELVSPPYSGFYPDGSPFKPDPQSAAFFDDMAELGYQYLMSEEDTGSGDKIHRNGSSTEWWVAFYRPGIVTPAEDLPHGFLADDRSNHDDYERVPYAFGFRTTSGTLDFVLVSVHLKPGSSSSDAARRLHEIETITTWVDQNNDVEKDFIILGDMNIEDCNELAKTIPAEFESLNDDCVPTNTNVNGPRPYDHIMYMPAQTGDEIDKDFGFLVVDLISEMRDDWIGDDPYPGDPYDHNPFRAYYSDHHPVVFQLIPMGIDDD